MDKRLWYCTGGMVVLCMVLQVVAAGAAPAGGREYGPCCPYVTGAMHQSAKPGLSYWGASGTFRGPERVCQTPRTVAVVYEGKVHRVDAVEVKGTVLVPQRVLALTGATIEYAGAGKTVATLGSRKVELTLGHHEVKITDGDKTSQTSWPLCPRQRHDISYVPLREAAMALGLSAEWQNRGIVLTNSQPIPTGMTNAKCPADQMEEDLGVTLLRGPLNGPFGPGVGILAVTIGGRASKLGLQPKDVILSANGQKVKCPMDLETAVSKASGAVSLDRLSVSRNGKQMDLVPSE